MTLAQLLVTLKNNANLFIVLVDEGGDEMITFNAGGYESVEGDLGAMLVTVVEINSLTTVRVHVKEATP